jgi:cell division protein FtsZ
VSSPFTIEENLQEELSGARIKAIGVGGGGGNMINHMIKSGVQGIELIVANTDAQVLQHSLCEDRIQLGAKLTKGLGAGMVPEIGRESAVENAEEIREYLDGSDIVFIAAGLGGGTGTGASSVIAQIAREIGALTIAVVTKPFSFEGAKRRKLADQGLEDLKKESDSIVVIPNDKLLSIVDKGLGIKESFKIVDEVLARAVTGTSGIILSNGENDINLDFADLRTVMSHRGMALMGMGEAEGEKSAFEAIKKAIESPLLDDLSIHGAMGVLVHFNIHPDYSLIEITDAMSIVHEAAHEDADIIMGTTTDPELPEDVVKITIIATGFEKELAPTAPPKQVQKPSDGTDLNTFQRRTNSEAPVKDATPSFSPPKMEAPKSSADQKFRRPAPQPIDEPEQPTFGDEQQNFDTPPSFGNGNSGFGGQQPSFDNGSSQNFGGGNSGFGGQPQQPQQNFGGNPSFGGQPQQQSNFGGNPSFGGQPQQQQQNFGGNPSFGGQSQQQNFGGGNSQQQQKKTIKTPYVKHQEANIPTDDELDMPTWLRQRNK